MYIFKMRVIGGIRPEQADRPGAVLGLGESADIERRNGAGGHFRVGQKIAIVKLSRR